MLTQVADGALVHQSELLQNNAVVVHVRGGVLLIDPGIQGAPRAACEPPASRAHRLGGDVDAARAELRDLITDVTT